ncbi:sn-glycerol-3-phosphate ABC transporter ATP-binding protein UgpC [Vallitalea pronyensis]|uniref:sn-glycerol-3-phosphate ABC transporter ATP-binding protein UgpC n=1 Tax=Vallitalea pronyensis TaxID=1348613 RepID=A0A8J8MNX0_9FIRM|nr:sn-glycerol-3-phosphate ABC transporter ATP-binding protein UgpC [Vallitalea pronyensis]QUI24668.1 sn-glycerol-3-phosphate ABC transporter ATP-binding protein UgpC [Vallitalea pronyensis]
MNNLELKNINKIYPGGVQAVYDFNITIDEGEFIVLVGPSGCGKSTLLRMMAGLEKITSGEMFFYGKKVNDVAPADRDIAMVFQNYALYGNMTVYENMGFSLTVRHENSDKLHKRVMEVADTVDLKDYLNRFPKNLSGGQRQRVALGRSIARDVGILLMDEPLSNLDAKLRSRTRRELVQLHNQLKATIVYVTHDQVEAMTMADRIVIMKDGYIQQIGKPEEVYLMPENKFVGSFMGSPPMKFIEGEISGKFFIAEDMKLEIPESRRTMLKDYQGKEVILGIRPEHFGIDPHMLIKHEGSQVDCVVDGIELLGADTLVFFNKGKSQLAAKCAARKQKIAYKDTLKLAVNMDDVHFFDIESEMRIR